jgi:GNAT superfamily N-acetyltransferase
MAVTVTTYYLQMTAPAELRPKRSERRDVAVCLIDPPLPELNRFFYTAVGGDWFWIDRLPWTYQQWLDYLTQPGMETWMLTAARVPAGYCELRTQPGGDAQVAYFGLLPQFAGLGLGGHLLTVAAERAWELGARRVWLHTCSLDHPAALPHYTARGFRVYHQESTSKELPPRAPGPWPGAR